MGTLIVALTLLQFTGPTGARIDLNAEAVGSIRDPTAMPKGHFAPGTHCIIVMRNGEAVTIAESCDEARQKVRELSRGPCTLVCGEAPRR